MFLLLTLCGVAGCTSVASRITEEVWTEGDEHSSTFTLTASAIDASKQGPPLELNAEKLNAYRQAQSTSGPLTVEGPETHRRLVDQIANSGGLTLQETENELGIQTNQTLHLVLIPVAREQWPSEFKASIESDPHQLIMPIIFDASIHSLAKFLAEENYFSTGFAGHEHFEFSLAAGDGNLRIAMDPESKFQGIPIRLKSFTRWYRDGFANFATMVWMEKLNERAGVTEEDRTWLIHQEGAVESLERVGTDIFRWTQFQDEDSMSYYEASTGLFLRLEEDFGREEIRSWNEAIEASTTAFKVRADLLKTAKEVFGVALPHFVRKGQPSSSAGGESASAP